MVVSCFVRCRLVEEKSHQKILVRFSERGSACGCVMCVPVFL